MKPGRSAIHRQTYALPTLRFEDRQLTSFSGLVIFQRLFEHLRLKNRVRDCFRHLRVRPIFGHASIVMLLIVHRLLRFNDTQTICEAVQRPTMRFAATETRGQQTVI